MRLLSESLNNEQRKSSDDGGAEHGIGIREEEVVNEKRQEVKRP